MSLVSDAIHWHQSGYLPLPVKPDGTKAPAVQRWSAYQQERPDLATMIELFKADHDGIGLICGAVSGNLEMMEAEAAAVNEGMIGKLAQAFADHGMADLWQRVSTGYCEATPSGGLHWYYRVDGPARPNTKIARRPGERAPEVLIETRGEGGFSVIAPSAGRTHGSGEAWRVLAGNRSTVPLLSAEDRDALYAIAGTLDQMPVIDSEDRHVAPAADGSVRPGDDFNARADWASILEPHGWKRVARWGDRLLGWQRPGKRHRGVSATTGRTEEDRLFVFSTATDFDTERPYSKFAAYAVLDHGGDYAAAARKLRADGYGQATPLSGTAGGSDGDSGGLQGLLPASGTGEAPTGPQGAELRVIGGSAVRVTEPASMAGIAAAHGPTEDGTARALVQLHHDRIRYCEDRREWVAWNGQRWQWSEGIVREHIRELVRVLPDHGDFRTYKRRAMSAAGVSGIERLARHDRRLQVHVDDMDARPYELNTPAGVIDLRTGERRDPDPLAMHTRMTPLAPDVDRQPELWLRFLDTTFGGDQALIDYVQRMFGLASIGAVIENLFAFAFGAGANGKTTLIETIVHALGRGEPGYATVLSSEALMAKKHHDHPAEIAQLAGVRLAVAAELNEGQRFDEARVKMLTGRDSIIARFMRGNPFSFEPSHTLILSGNHKPDTGAGGPAFWRRLRLVPFLHIVAEQDRNPRLGMELFDEAAAVLAWVIDGAVSYHKIGLATPAAVTNATAEYAADQDTVTRFVDEQCHTAIGNDAVRLPVTEFRSHYEAWCREMGEEPVSAKRLGMDLATMGIPSVRGTKGRRFYVGVTVLNEGTPWWS